ncbi:thrombospondin type-1 domain-containing protein 1 [Neosynchiropus ocellatus]
MALQLGLMIWVKAVIITRPVLTALVLVLRGHAPGQGGGGPLKVMWRRNTEAVSPLLLLLTGYAVVGLNIWPSLHEALGSGSVFVDFRTTCDSSGLRRLRLSLIDMETNTSVQTRTLSGSRPAGRVEFNCSCFLYAGTFRFLLQQTCAALEATSDGTGSRRGDSTARRWSSELRVQWPTFHIAVERAADQSQPLQVRISTNEHFRACSSVRSSALTLEVSYWEHDEVQARSQHAVRLVPSQVVRLSCVFPFTDRDFIRVSLRSPHSPQEVKSSGPLYPTQLFSYKLLVEDAQKYRSGCEGGMRVQLMSPPCAGVNGKVALYKDGAAPPLTFNWLAPGEDLTQFNCSLFSTGRRKYCLRFVPDLSRAPSPAQTCLVVHRSADSWGPWQQWSACSATCGAGVRERVRKCLLPSSAGGMQCTGMVQEQSLCSLENCAGLPPLPPETNPSVIAGAFSSTASPAPSPSPPSPSAASLGGHAVVVAGISLCLAVILATVVVTLWRKLCQTPACSPVRRSSTLPPGGRKLSDEASVCGHGLPPPSPLDPAAQGDGPLSQDLERLSPSGQKMLPTVFGYRLAQQQLKQMKKVGLKEATQLYHVSSSPVRDTLTAAPTVSPIPSPTGFILSACAAESHPSLGEATLSDPPSRPPDRPGPRAQLVLPPRTSGSSRSVDRTAEWVEMVERSGLGGGVRADPGLGNMSNKNPSFRRTSSFNDPKPHLETFRERSLTQVGSRTLPEGSSWTRRAKERRPHYAIPENECTQAGPQRKTWWDRSASAHAAELQHAGTTTKVSPPDARPGLAHRFRLEEGLSGIGGPVGGNSLSVDRAEQNWHRRGPSPIQRNILARKLKEAQSSASCRGRQRSSTFSASPSAQETDSRGSQRASEVYSTTDRSSYRLSEAEQRMLDLDLSSR